MKVRKKEGRKQTDKKKTRRKRVHVRIRDQEGDICVAKVSKEF